MWTSWIKRAVVMFVTLLTILIVSAIVFPAFVLAETVTPSPDMGGFWTAVGSNHWPLAVGIGLTILVWAMRSFVMHKIPKKALPWVTLGLAIVGTAGTRMVQAIGDEVVWWQGLVQGVLEGATVGFAAIGWWDVKQAVKKNNSNEG